MNVKDMHAAIDSASESDLNSLALTFSTLNVKNRNEDKTKQFAQKILVKNNNKKEIFKTFIESSSINGLIYAPTQVGKSAATIKLIETCFYNGVPVIVSTDNKNDQQEQLFNRIKSDLVLDNVLLVKASDKTFTRTIEKCIKEKFNNFVIFCLDNACQIEKVTNLLCILYMKYNFSAKKLAIIHDEADNITKDSDTSGLREDQPVSHQKWLELHNLINTKMNTIDLKRIFVTATPENCVMLYNITCPDVMRLEIPQNYTGYDKIQHIDVSGKNIETILLESIDRIKRENTFEAILYCVERSIKNGQEQILQDLASKLSCVVNTYNGNGIHLYIPTQKLAEAFKLLLDDTRIDYNHQGFFFSIEELSIRKFYSMIKKIGENCVVTIGKDLICRGISYVGEDFENPITATTMIYKPGTKMHNVGICQTIGRITGCAMPNLQRRLYCTKDVYDNYITYNKNQETYMNNFHKASETQTTKEIIEELIFHKTSRPIDKPALKLKMRMEESNDEEDTTDDCIDGVKVKNLKRWMTNNTVVGQILNALYRNELKFTIEELSKEIEYCGSLQELKANVDGGRGKKCQYGKLWNYRLEHVSLNKNIRDYLDKNM